MDQFVDMEVKESCAMHGLYNMCQHLGFIGAVEFRAWITLFSDRTGLYFFINYLN